MNESYPQHNSTSNSPISFHPLLLFILLIDDLQQAGQWLHGLLASRLWSGGCCSADHNAGMATASRRHVGRGGGTNEKENV